MAYFCEHDLPGCVGNVENSVIFGNAQKMIFSIHFFFAEGKKVKGMVRNDVFGGWGR